MRAQFGKLLDDGPETLDGLREPQLPVPPVHTGPYPEVFDEFLGDEEPPLAPQAEPTDPTPPANP